MKKILCAAIALFGALSSTGAAGSVTVNQSGSGNFTSIQAAIDSGASLITITDSGHYVENLEIGGQDTGGPAVTLTSNKTGTNLPVITPSAIKFYVNSARNSQGAGFGLFANNSVVSNLILEGQPDLGQMAPMTVVANNVLIENCLFRIAAGTTNAYPAARPLLFIGQQGDGIGNATPGGQDSNGTIIRNCEFTGLAPDANPVEPTADNRGYLGKKTDPPPVGTGQASGYVRIDMSTVAGEDVFITFEGCYFHHDLDYGIFPTDSRADGGSLNINIKKCRFDANGKFFYRGRGVNVNVESSIFTRAGQTRATDTENSAVAINVNAGHIPSGTVSNCVFVNCGSASYQQAYFGGVNIDSGDFMTVDRCTFVDCVSGVGAGSGNSGDLFVSRSIFHQIGDNVPPSVDNDRVTLTNGSPDLVNGLYPAWTNGLANFVNKYSAVFNRWRWNNDSKIIINTCLVGSIDTEDTNSWDDALLNGVTGCRLFAGYDTNFFGANTVTRGTPIFVTTDPNAPNAFQLAGSSPGQGLGANLAPVLEPKLTISRAGNQVNISWTPPPIWMKGSLKSTPSLTGPVWTPVVGVSNNSVVVPIGSANRFFAIIND